MDRPKDKESPQGRVYELDQSLRWREEQGKQRVYTRYGRDLERPEVCVVLSGK